MDKPLHLKVYCELCKRRISRPNLAKHRRKCTIDRPAKRGGDRHASRIDIPCHTTILPSDNQNKTDDITKMYPNLRDCCVVLHRLKPSQYQYPVHRRRAGFSCTELDFLRETFSGQLGQSLRFFNIKQLLASNKVGLDMLDKFKLLQIRDRIKCFKH